MLALYRCINRPEVMRTTIEGDFGAALRDPSPEHFGQLHVAGREARNYARSPTSAPPSASAPARGC